VPSFSGTPPGGLGGGACWVCDARGALLRLVGVVPFAEGGCGWRLRGVPLLDPAVAAAAGPLLLLLPAKLNACGGRCWGGESGEAALGAGRCAVAHFLMMSSYW